MNPTAEEPSADLTRDSVVDQAWSIAASEGIEGLTLTRIADLLGVPAPTLYNDLGNKSELVKAVNDLTIRRMFTALDKAVTPYSLEDSYEALTALARAYRAYANTYPIPYTLAFATTDPAARPDSAELVLRTQPYMQRIAHMVGEEKSLIVLRGAIALLHGFVMLELHDKWQRGGDMDATFDELVAHFFESWKIR